MHEMTDAIGSVLGKFAYGVDRVFTRVNDKFNEICDGLKKKEEPVEKTPGLEMIPISEDGEVTEASEPVKVTSEPPRESILEKYGPAALSVLILAASFVGLFAVGSLATGASITAAAGEILLCMIS